MFIDADANGLADGLDSLQIASGTVLDSAGSLTLQVYNCILTLARHLLLIISPAICSFCVTCSRVMKVLCGSSLHSILTHHPVQTRRLTKFKDWTRNGRVQHHQIHRQWSNG